MSRLRPSKTRNARIARYETMLTKLLALLAGPATPKAAAAACPLAERLSRYYESPDWKRDFAADEAGLLPPELRRGVLSEDGIYHALEAYREWTTA